jgi:post-segregation antitoxin (ccd killing protein)
MGRPKKLEEEKKIKIGITVDRDLYNQLKKEKIVPSRLFDKLLKEYYAKKNL